MAENLKYIELEVEVEIEHDEHQRMYAVPRAPVEYSVLFRHISTHFVQFYRYINEFDKATSRPEIDALLRYYRALSATTPLEEYIRGFKTVQELVKTNPACRSLARQQQHLQWTSNTREVKEAELNQLFLAGSIQVSLRSPQELYKADYAIAQYYYQKRMPTMAIRFAKEALDVATKTSSSHGIEASAELIQQIERAHPGIGLKEGESLGIGKWSR